MARMIEVNGVWMEPPGHEALWRWFGFSHASWLTMPRVLMHAMPDDWQARMAALLYEYDAHWNLPDCGTATVTLKQDGKFAPMPDWLEYRHPDEATIDSFRASQPEEA